MTKDELIAWRQIILNMLLSELTVRNSVLLETIRTHISGQPGVTEQDGIRLTVSVLEEMKVRNHKLFQGHAEAQMLADEMREAIESLQQLAKDHS